MPPHAPRAHDPHAPIPLEALGAIELPALTALPNGPAAALDLDATPKLDPRAARRAARNDLHGTMWLLALVGIAGAVLCAADAVAAVHDYFQRR